jgi:hypothetical protein
MSFIEGKTHDDLIPTNKPDKIPLTNPEHMFYYKRKCKDFSLSLSQSVCPACPEHSQRGDCEGLRVRF